MISNNAARNGFTIVELLIVIVVIAILAAIAIVSYIGITQKASTTSVNSTASQWVSLVQTTKLASGFTFPNNANTCLASSSSDYPASDGFSAGACVILDGVTAVSYSSAAFTSWPSSQPRPSGSLPITQTTTGGSTIKARGIWIASSDSLGFTIRWIPQVSDQCGIGTTLISNGVGSTSGGLCVYSVTY